MAGRVVDRLEAVEVDEDHRGRARLVGHGPGGRLVEAAPVEHAGEEVGAGVRLRATGAFLGDVDVVVHRPAEVGDVGQQAGGEDRVLGRPGPDRDPPEARVPLLGEGEDGDVGGVEDE